MDGQLKVDHAVALVDGNQRVGVEARSRKLLTKEGEGGIVADGGRSRLAKCGVDSQLKIDDAVALVYGDQCVGVESRLGECLTEEDIE